MQARLIIEYKWRRFFLFFFFSLLRSRTRRSSVDQLHAFDIEVKILFFYREAWKGGEKKKNEKETLIRLDSRDINNRTSFEYAAFSQPASRP